MDESEVTKQDFRGKRNTNTKTVKRKSHVFDDEKDVKGGRRGHSRHQEDFREDEIIDSLDEIDPSFDWKKLVR